MGMMLSRQGSGDSRLHGVGQGWNDHQHSKKQWNRWVRRSMIGVGVAHLLVLALWPAWYIEYRESSQNIESIQFWDISATRTLGEAEEDSPTTALRSPEEPEVDLPSEGDGGITENPNLLQLFTAPPPEIVDFYLPSTVSSSTEKEPPPAPVMLLDLELAAIDPRPARLPSTINYPLIRNPVAVARFLRTRYNPIHEAGGAQGQVTVMMWVNESGAVDWCEVSESSGNPELDQIALALFNDIAVFRAARSEGTRIPVAVLMSVPLSDPW
jgi:TonB family protein